MNQHAREQQRRCRERRKAAGFTRIDLWIPADLMAELRRRHRAYGPFQKPATALIALARRALRLPRPQK